MTGLVGGPLLMGGLGPGPPAPLNPALDKQTDAGENACATFLAKVKYSKINHCVVEVQISFLSGTVMHSII